MTVLDDWNERIKESFNRYIPEDYRPAVIVVIWLFIMSVWLSTSLSIILSGNAFSLWNIPTFFATAFFTFLGIFYIIMAMRGELPK